MSKQHEPRVLGHADEADGIEEYDNPLPDWWLGLFWLTIIWGGFYAVHYHFWGNRSQEGEFIAEMQAADERWPEQAQAAIQFAMSDAAVTSGEAVYQQNCFPCHGVNLEGGIGPAFDDDEWIHGGTADDVLRIIREGVLTKGMVAWEGILSPEQINDVTAYIVARNMDATGRTLDSYLASSGMDAEPAEADTVTVAPASDSQGSQSEPED